MSSVVRDQTVQAQGGDAIWSSVIYAITPSWLSWVWQPRVIDVENLAAAEEKLGSQADSVVQDLIPEDRASVDTVASADNVSSNSSRELMEKKSADERIAPVSDRSASSDTNPLEYTSNTINDSVGKKPREEKENAGASDSVVPKQFIDAYEERNWSGTGSGFL